MQYVLQRRDQAVRRRTASRAAWQQVCFAKPRSRGGRSALGSEAHELSDQAERLRTPPPANFAREDA